ncbi:taste receptor type 2 member 40-like [Anomaloglossus baeobatrachus]|uniref:taste receptor type 2 member 40-like n=1 Tax=Anomaloglossus baeobatrachus TaxID=238106 RepID=UPI003F50C20C
MDIMGLVLQYIFDSVLYIECIVGIIMNFFIVAANFMKWKTMRSLHIGDKILSSLATSRFLFLLNVFMNFVPPLDTFWANRNLQVMSAMSVVTTFLHSTNLWFATILCVFYCVKITNYNWNFLILLKNKMSTFFPRFLLVSLLISLFSSLPFGWCIFILQIQNLTNLAMENVTLPKVGVQENFHNMFLLFLTGSCPPFLIFLVADFLLLHSLWMHTRRMRNSTSSFRSPNLESHFSAVKSMSLFLVLHILYFICSSVYFMSEVYDSGAEFSIISAVISSPPSLHSLYIISSNTQLKKIFISIFHGLKCCRQELEL